MSEPMPKERQARNPWLWIPSLYLAEGLPYVVVMSVAVTMYKRFGMSNTDIGLYTSWFYLPWVIKPLWAPVVDILGTRRRWVWVMQLLVGAALAALALSLPGPAWLHFSLIFFWLLAFQSATHDIAADGFYLLGTDEKQAAQFVGVRTMFYRIATIFGQGLLVMLAGTLEKSTGRPHTAWAITLGVLAAMFALFGLWHRFALPRPEADRPGEARQIPTFMREFLATFGSFFSKPRIFVLMAFLLLYRLGEAQLVKMVSPFLLDGRNVGGLGLDTTQVGFVYGTVGILALTFGGILGGIVIARDGLKRWLWPMLFAIHLPDAIFIALAAAQPTNLGLILGGVAIEQFGYGFGFTAYVMYMMYISRGERQTAHYAICTGFMALGMMMPGMWSGWLQDQVGYLKFFTIVIAATLPSFLVTAFLPLDADFGRKKAE